MSTGHGPLEPAAPVTATFTVSMVPGGTVLEGTGRFDLVKTWHGAIEGTSRGVMLTAGDPEAGSAGYVALEVFEGAVGGHAGTLTLQQSGTMESEDVGLAYRIVPGGGSGALAGLRGEITIEGIAEDGTHHVALTPA